MRAQVTRLEKREPSLSLRVHGLALGLGLLKSDGVLPAAVARKPWRARLKSRPAAETRSARSQGCCGRDQVILRLLTLEQKKRRTVSRKVSKAPRWLSAADKLQSSLQENKAEKKC